MRFPAFLLAAFLAVLVLVTGRVAAQRDSEQITVAPGAGRDEVTFSTENGPQFIVVRDFKVIDIQPTGNDDEYTLTLLALTVTGEPDQRVVGSILFEVDGQSTLVPFEQGGVGDVTVKAQPGASVITLRAVDSNTSHTMDLPGTNRLPWFVGGGVLVVLLAVMARRRRALAAHK